MTLSDMNPFIRFAEKVSIGNTKSKRCRDCRLFFVLEGNGKIKINEQIYPFAPNTALLWQAGTKYRFYSDKSVTLISVNFDFDNSRKELSTPFELINENDKFTDFKVWEFYDCDILNSPIVCDGNFTLLRRLEDIVSEKASALLFSSEKCSAILKSCIIELIRGSSATPRNNEALETVIEYIKNHYSEDITNTSLAALVNYHPYYLNKLFSQVNGITLHQYLINYRLSVAKTLLLSGDASICEVASASGFPDPSSFSYSFKKNLGISPSEYRQSARKLL